MIRRRSLFGAIALATTLAATSALPGRWGLDYFPNTSLLDQEGQELRFVDDLLDGRIAVVNRELLETRTIVLRPRIFYNSVMSGYTSTS